MEEITKETLIAAWNYCDREDKSIEFMFAYMSDVSGVDYEDVVAFVLEYERTKEDMKL
jgi:hypothetical protein